MADGLSPCMSRLYAWTNTDFRPGSINNSDTTSLKPTLDLIRIFDLTYEKKRFGICFDILSDCVSKLDSVSVRSPRSDSK